MKSNNIINTDLMPHAKIKNDIAKPEERYDNHKQGVWEFDLDDFVKPIEPKKYFVTTGDAVCKTKRLISDIENLLSDSKKMLEILEKIRGSNVYLETRWENGKLLLLIKNPRNTSNQISLEEENVQ